MNKQEKEEFQISSLRMSHGFVVNVVCLYLENGTKFLTVANRIADWVDSGIFDIRGNKVLKVEVVS